MRPEAIVLDIEGTVGSVRHVKDVLYPYARDRLPAWFASNRGTPRAEQLIDSIAAHAARPSLHEADAISVLEQWTDSDVKAPPLKTLQGWIWEAGYADGSLTGHVYAEVPGVLDGWVRAGITLYVYSSGSISAQVAWFARTPYGDLSHCFAGHFDLETAGNKKTATSYRRISHKIGVAPEATVFLSDSPDELDAAAQANWRTIAIQREEDGHVLKHSHPVARTLDDLVITNYFQA